MKIYLETQKPSPTKVLTEERIGEITREIFYNVGSVSLKKDELECEIIRQTKCDLKTAEAIFSQMLSLGLEVCCFRGPSIEYSIRKFVNMRGYVSDEELEKMDNELLEEMKKIDNDE